jgi:CRISPR type III-A-associated protein Csm2
MEKFLSEISYFDEDGNIKENLFSEIAKNIVEWINNDNYIQNEKGEFKCLSEKWDRNCPQNKRKFDKKTRQYTQNNKGEYLCKDKIIEWKKDCPEKNRLKKNKKITYTQIRKFYEEVLNLKTQLEQLNLQSKKENKQEDNFRKILPYFKMLKAKAHVAYERDVINTNFKKFIEENVDYVTKKDENASMEEKFKIFCTFFEAVVAYAKGTINE